MAILQALLAFVTRSAGKILNAIFGWAVHALFGKTSSRDATLLSALVAAAAAWPLLVAGVIAPKVAAFVLAFVPLPHSVPSWIVRIVWATLAFAVPVALGLTLAARRPPSVQADPVWKRILRGFPVTLGLAAAFVVMFVTVPVVRLVALIRRQKSADIPLVTDAAAYHTAAQQIVEALNRHGFQMKAAEPGWWVKAPTRILAALGGKAFAGLVPKEVEHYVGPHIAVSFYASGVLLKGKSFHTPWAHGIIVETAALGDGLQTLDPKAQKLEREIAALWKSLPAEPGKKHRHRQRVSELTTALCCLDVSYDDWQTLYRQILQLDRAACGQRQLLDDGGSRDSGSITPHTQAPNDEDFIMPTRTIPENHNPSRPSQTSAHAAVVPRVRPAGTPPAGSPAALSTPQILAAITRETQDLIKTQIELVKAEVRADVTRELNTVKGIGAAALAALAGVNLLLMGGVLGLAQVMPAWLAALVGAAVLWVIGAAVAIYAWQTRVRRPLEHARRELGRDVRWMKERLT